jgi:glycosyltransferase involved in cell wall biosynthesis
MSKEKKSKKILIICPYPKNTAAGQRLKYEQYISDWELSNYQVEISPFMNLRMWEVVHKKGHTLRKLGWTLLGLLKRATEIFRLKKYEIIYIHMYVDPIGTSLFERIYRLLSKKIIYDLEDNRLLGANKEVKGIAQMLRGTGKTRFLVKSADHVITSSPALNDTCLQINEKGQSTYISSSINTDRFVPNNKYTNENKVTIGWTGTFSTRPYLDLLRPVFVELRKQRDFKLIVISNFEYDFPEIDLEVIQWSAEKEVEDLQKIDIGVYPLPLDDWVMGKSGLKAIQYMSFGLPCVATDISTVQQFIIDGKNGFLVKTDDEWVNKLVELIDSPSLRKEVGENARKTVLEKFSKHVVKRQYLSILDSIVGRA